MLFKVGIALTLVLATTTVIIEAKYSHFFVDTPMSYEDALRHCRSADYDLANVESAAKHSEVLKTMRMRGFTRLWIGVNRRHDTHDNPPFNWHYERIPLQRVRVFFWAKGEPNNFRKHKERCVEILDRKGDPRYTDEYNWNDQRCEFKNAFICERY